MPADLTRPLRSWGRSLWPLPATSDGLALLCCAAIVGARLTSTMGLVVALPSSVAASTRPWLNLTMACLFVAQSVLVVAVLVVRKSPMQPRLLALDIAVFALLLLAQPFFLGDEADVAGWDAWAFGTSLATIVLAGVATTTARGAAMAGGVMVIFHLAGNLPLSIPAGSTATTVSNACTMFVNILVVHAVWSFLRRLGAQADLAEHEAERRGVSTERARLKPILHENAGLLTMWLRSSEQGNATTARSVKTMVGRIRAALEDREEAVADTLSGIVEDVCSDFPDLAVDTNTMLISHLIVPSDQLVAFRDTLTTVLSNVRLHAQASQVIVFADSWEEDDLVRWIVDVHDDGVGFDPLSTNTRFGLNDQVQVFRNCGGEVVVTSTPSEGTTVQLSSFFPRSQTNRVTQ